MKKAFAAIICTLIFIACSVSYKFTGTNIDYNVIKTIEIREFMNQAPLVYAPLSIELNEHIQDMFTRNTKLSFVSNANADLELEGEIIRYDLTPMAIKEDAFESQTRLTMAVKIRFTNNKDSNQDKEETVSAYKDFDSNQMLTDVQDQLNKQLIEDIVDQIFNVTLSDW